ncbi:hypothetical protein [Aporhodopirellula aestuarii]|uniref:Uncharacterized protein n=1 Tax=Aporhodopirellula aestuarii TaxID=2950107 RepID=A0ABT0U1E7_9BACT|nr:hypothetical protein [Aporhodopirellula aestuarii]MCM2370677.1 hypothetical protein [Aporhodopirellula aestuarii]
MKDEIRIRLSAGLIVVAVLHAVMLAAVFTALHRTPKPQVSDEWRLPTARPAPQVGRQIEKLPEPAHVNLEAQGELKQQSGYCPPSCPPVVRPTIRPYHVVPARPVVQPATPSPTTVPAPTVPAPIFVTPTNANDNAVPQPSPKRYQIALFIGNDAKSQQLLEWFNKDAKLSKLRKSCEFQVYTESNALYKTRFADIVPASQFPVVLFQDSSGGHVHAAGYTMLPSTPAELYDDLRHGYELYQQTRQAQKTGALKSRGYSWDSAISPTLQLSPEDCPDGYCPIEPTEPTWRPFDRDRDREPLFDRDSDGRNALIWAGAGELATLALIVVAIILLGFILIKRGM